MSQNVPFATAHEVTGTVVRYCESERKDLFDLTPDDLGRIDERLAPAVLEVIDLDRAIASRTGYGATAPARVREQIERFGGATRERRAWASAPAGRDTGSGNGDERR